MPTAAYFFSESTGGGEKKKKKKEPKKKNKKKKTLAVGNQWIFFFKRDLFQSNPETCCLFVYFVPTGEADLRRKVVEK